MGFSCPQPISFLEIKTYIDFNNLHSIKEYLIDIIKHLDNCYLSELNEKEKRNNNKR